MAGLLEAAELLLAAGGVRLALSAPLLVRRAGMTTTVMQAVDAEEQIASEAGCVGVDRGRVGTRLGTGFCLLQREKAVRADTVYRRLP